MSWLLVFSVAYLTGSISPSYFLGHLFLRKDMRREGSGNLGARNSLEIGGATFGILVFLLDIFKGVGTILWIQVLYNEPLLVYCGMLGVIIGHNFSIYLGLRGGKGLASMVGVLIVINPYILLTMGILLGFFTLIAHSSSVGAILGVLPFGLIFGLFTGDWSSLIFTIPLTAIVLYKHRPEEYEAVLKFLRGEKK